MDKRIEAFFIPRWMHAYREKYGDLRCAQSLPMEGPGLYRCPQAAIFDETIKMSKKFVYWIRKFPDGPITRSIMEPLLGKEILLNYTNRGGRSTEMYPKVVKAVLANSAQLADPGDGEKAFTISFLGINCIRLEVNWKAQNPDYCEDHHLRCYVCGNFTPAHGFCTCRD